MAGASLDPRLPVLVGAGQISNRVDQGDPPLEPAALMAEALRRAEADTGRSGVLRAADSIRVVVQLSWRYRNTGAAVAELVGASPRQTVYTVMGGNYVQTLVNQTALDIQDGRLDVVLLTGGEAWRTRSNAKKSGVELNWTTQGDDVEPPEIFGDDKDLIGPAELARSIVLPVQVYPMFDIALRAHERLTVDEHRRRIAELWSGFSRVAASNPHAWIQREYSPEEIMTATPDNRMVGFPYTKVLNSNNMVDQGAGLILCSVAKARELGIPQERWVFLHSGTDAHDHWFVSNRDNLYSSPAMRFGGACALELAGIGVDDLAHVDLYSCFPSAVQLAAREIGIGLDRQLTVTGGMSFAGGPWNNYVMHSIATMAGVLRADPGGFGLCTANGGYLTKHAFGVYSTEPPRKGRFQWRDVQDRVDALPARDVASEYEGDVDIEAYTVMHDRDGNPERGLAAVRLPDGRRGWGTTGNADAMTALLTTEMVGQPAKLAVDGSLSI